MLLVWILLITVAILAFNFGRVEGYTDRINDEMYPHKENRKLREKIIDKLTHENNEIITGIK